MMETINNIMILNFIGIIIIILMIGFHMSCELMIKKYMRRKLMNKSTQTTEYRKYIEDDLENIYNDSAYQYAKKLKTRFRC